MIRLVFAVILALAGIVLIARRSAVTQEAQDRVGYRDAVPEKRVNLRPIGAALLTVAVLLIAWASTYRLDAGEAAVLKTFGNVGATDASPGFGIKAPWASVVKFDIRNQTITLAGDGKADTEQGAQVQTVTSDNATVTYDTTIRYSLNPDMLGQVARQYPDQESFIARAVLPGVQAVTRDAPTAFTAATVRQSRGPLSQRVKDGLEGRLGAVGVTVEQVDPQRITLDGTVQSNYDRVQSSLANAEASKADLQTALAKAEITKTDAQAQSDADQIIRCGAQSVPVKEIINGKETTAMKVHPVPNAQCQNRLNEQVLTSKYIDMLSDAAQKGNTMYVLPQGVNNLLQLPAVTKK
jgi:regulator of protease activity HflC (stomatin/prohibitin superfamily)